MGEGLASKDVGTVLHALGLSISPSQLKELRTEWESSSISRLEWAQFKKILGRYNLEGAAGSSKTVDADKLAHLNTALDYHIQLRNALGGSSPKKTFSSTRKVPIIPVATKERLYNSKSSTLTTGPTKLEDLLQVLRSVGDRFTEEECEDFVRDLRQEGLLNDGRVDIGSLRNWVLN